MDQRDLPTLDHFDLEEDSPGLIDRGLFQTESIDLKGLIAELDVSAGQPTPREIQATSFGKLMEALPIPALLLSRQSTIIFANQACEKISAEYSHIQGQSFSAIFPDARAASKAQSLVDTVFLTRKTQVVEGVLQMGGRKIWGRTHLRSLKDGQDGSVLVLIEDLTLEKSQLRLQQKVRKELETRVEERTADLLRTNERLQKEVTDRKRAQEGLRQSEMRYRLLSHHFPNGAICMLDRTLRHMVADGSGLSSLGLSSESMEGKTIWEVYPPETCAEMEPRLRSALAGKLELYEMKYGGQILEFRALPIRNDDGEVVACMVMTQDITARKRAEEELKKHRQHLEELVAERTGELVSSIKRLKQEVKERKKIEDSLRSTERRFNVAFRANPAAVSIASLSEGRYLEVNDSFCQATGRAREEVLGRTETELKCWARYRHWQQMLVALKEHGSLSDYEAVFRRKNGKMFVGSVYAETIELEGEPYILAMVVDITERKRAERDRRRMTTALEQTAESVIIADVDGTIRYSNPAVTAVSAYTRDEIRGQNVNILRSPLNDKKVLAEAKQVLKDGNRWKGRLINQRKDGGHYEVETTISPVKGESGTVLNFVFVERDVTNEVKLEKRLRQSQKMEAIGTLAGGVAHDFNNILMAMLGYAQLARKVVPDDSSAAKDLHEVLLAGKRAKDLIHQILTFSRQSEQERQPVEVHLVVKEVLRLLRASIPSYIEMRVTIDSDTGAVMADPTQLHQVVMNLCTNAYHAMKDMHGVLEVSLTPEEVDGDSEATRQFSLTPGPYIRLTVSDTGHGIPTEIIDRIFDPYFTTKEPGKGTGMGLAVVHGIVTALGGGIAVQSDPEKGSSFHVYLPLCRTCPETVVTEVGSSVLRGTARILFVDDERQLAELGKRALEILGYEVTSLTESRKALETFREKPEGFDLLVTDLTMPDMTGLELAREIMVIRPGIPVILCTGYADALNVGKVRQMGIAELLQKPVTPEDLGKSVAAALAGQPDQKAPS